MKSSACPRTLRLLFVLLGLLSALGLRAQPMMAGPIPTPDDGKTHKFEARNHQQAGDPVKLASAIVQLAGLTEPPLRFAAGSDAVEGISASLAERAQEVQRWRALSYAAAGWWRAEGECSVGIWCHCSPTSS